MRTVKEWVGRSDDDPVPPRVRLRVFEKHDGICCECTTKIRGKRWICDHRVALVNGGENRESNLGPICELCNLVKTAADVAEKSKVNRVRMKHLGIRKRKSRPMPGSRASGIKMLVGGGWVRR